MTTYKFIKTSLNAHNIAGMVFGRLTAICPVRRSACGRIMWLCICRCTTEHIVTSKDLKNGKTKSCGCIRSELIVARNTRHKMSRSPECKTWYSIRERCFSKNGSSYQLYGGRGIKMCNRWFNSFECFFSDMGKKPSPDHSIDRIDNDGDYTPENCRWATRRQQQNNTRRNVFIEYSGHRLTIAQWSRRTGLKQGLIRYRNIHGWSIGRMLRNRKEPPMMQEYPE